MLRDSREKPATSDSDIENVEGKGHCALEGEVGVILQESVAALRIPISIYDPCGHDSIFDRLINFVFEIFCEMDVLADCVGEINEFLCSRLGGIKD